MKLTRDLFIKYVFSKLTTKLWFLFYLKSLSYHYFSLIIFHYLKYLYLVNVYTMFNVFNF